VSGVAPVPRTRALVVEDEPIARRQLRELLADVAWLEVVGEASDGRQAVTMIDALRPELVFLDIELPELSGLDVLRRVSHLPAVVFTTAYDRYAVAAFELEAVDYLLKPFGRERLGAAVERVRRTLVQHAGDAPSAERARAALDRTGPLTRIFVRERDRIVPVQVADIERLEAEDDYVAVVTRGRRHLVYLGMNEFEARLEPGRFLRVHRSHIVNLDHVRALVPYDATRLQVEMKDGTAILASRARSKELRHLVL
jgi:two-component system, LytTR family, response regulator